MPHSIAPYLEKEQLRKVEALGIETLEQLQAAAQAACLELKAFLGTDVDALLAAVPFALEAIPPNDLETIETAEYPLGVELDLVANPTIAPTFEIISEPPGGGCANLLAQMPPIRDQGSRGTCVAHAALAAFEQFLVSKKKAQDLSEQFLYWNCKRSDGAPWAAGTWLGIAMPLLQRDGCCIEPTWSYNPLPIAGSEGQGPPPGGALLQALSVIGWHRFVLSLLPRPLTTEASCSLDDRWRSRSLSLIRGIGARP